MRRILPALFLLIGVALLAGAAFAIRSEMRFRDGAIETDGQVVEMLRRRGSGDSRNSYTYLPVFTFSLPDGTQRRVEGGVSSNPPCCTVGEQVRVRYRPEAPERAVMTGFMESWFLATLLGGMGIVFMLAGAGVFVGLRRGGVAAAGMPPPAGPVMTFAVPLVGLRRQPGQWFLQARWADPRSGAQRLFESPAIPFDPVPQMQAMTSVPVSFDPADPNGPYAMDLSFLRDPR
jgi:hypothetical protein